jgi:hypothetical protein
VQSTSHSRVALCSTKKCVSKIEAPRLRLKIEASQLEAGGSCRSGLSICSSTL